MMKSQDDQRQWRDFIGEKFEIQAVMVYGILSHCKIGNVGNVGAVGCNRFAGSLRNAQWFRAFRRVRVRIVLSWETRPLFRKLLEINRVQRIRGTRTRKSRPPHDRICPVSRGTAISQSMESGMRAPFLIDCSHSCKMLNGRQHSLVLLDS